MHKKTKSYIGTIINNQNHKKQQYCRGRTLGDPKGITLIALVITIVVLIILAGVAINLTLGENGIFNKTKYAKEEYKKAEVKERVELAIADIQTDKITKGEECTVDTIISELPGKISGLTISKDGDNAKGTYNGCDFTITPDLKVTIDGYNPSAGGSTGGGTGGNTPTTPPTPTTYSVTFNGTNVTSNGAESVEENATYTATLTATSGYSITSLTVTMGGTTLVENTGYTYSSGNLSIPNVSGDIVITATGQIEITASNYGQYVNYGIDLDSNGNTTDDWQIFYKEEDTSSPNYGATYIIADYYVPASKMTTSISSSKAGMTQYSDSTYRVYWSSAPTYQPISDTVKKVFMYDYTETSNANVKAVSRLLNTDNWKDEFVTPQLQAKGGLAIGGPTLNMWCASWNKAYEAEKITPSIPDGGTGYQVNGSTLVDLTSYTGYKTDAQNVYFPKKSKDSDGSYGYWLASPSSDRSSRLMYVNYNGFVGYYGYDGDIFGVRPLVYLPSSITLEPSGTANVWNINYGE